MKLDEVIKPAPPPKSQNVRLTRQLMDELEALSPGQVMQIKLASGRKFVIVEQEDFEHIAATGGMGLNESGSAETGTEK